MRTLSAISLTGDGGLAGKSPAHSGRPYRAIARTPLSPIFKTKELRSGTQSPNRLTPLKGLSHY